jgi:hypothetical protein
MAMMAMRRGRRGTGRASFLACPVLLPLFDPLFVDSSLALIQHPRFQLFLFFLLLAPTTIVLFPAEFPSPSVVLYRS